MASIAPTRPQARRDAPLPELRSRRVRILNVPMGESQSWLAQGWAGELSVRLRFFLACGLAG